MLCLYLIVCRINILNLRRKDNFEYQMVSCSSQRSSQWANARSEDMFKKSSLKKLEDVFTHLGTPNGNFSLSANIPTTVDGRG